MVTTQEFLVNVLEMLRVHLAMLGTQGGDDYGGFDSLSIWDGVGTVPDGYGIQMPKSRFTKDLFEGGNGRMCAKSPPFTDKFGNSWLTREEEI